MVKVLERISERARDVQYCSVCWPRRSRNTPAEDFRSRGLSVAFAAAETLTPEQKSGNPGARVSGERQFTCSAGRVSRSCNRKCGPPERKLRGAFRCSATGAICKLLSQLAWMDEEYLAKDPVVNLLAAKGTDFTEEDKTDAAREAAGIAGRGAAGISHRRGARANRDFHHAVLPPDSAALVRHGYRAGFQSAYAAAAAGVSLSGRRARTTVARAKISRASIRQAAGWVLAFGGLGFGRSRWKSPRIWDSSGLRRTKACWGALEISGSGAMRAAIRKMVRIFIRRGSCSAAGTRWSDFSATIIFRIWWALFTAGWVPRRRRRICIAAFARSAIATAAGARRR